MIGGRTGAAWSQGTFVTTHWSVVISAAQGEPAAAAAALESLCRTYWYPLYAYVRRKGHAPEEAEDLTQAFFARLLEKGYLARAHPARGKFRTFLLSSMQRFLINEWEKLRAAKRGAGQSAVPWDALELEKQYQSEPSAEDSPETLFERRWAMALLEDVLDQLQSESMRAGKAAQFQALKRVLWGGDWESYSAAGLELGMTEGALKLAVHRLKARYRELLRAEVARTVTSRDEVDEELRYLLKVISR
jgi:RNA polymerase sigma factor (sigma-70 family)